MSSTMKILPNNIISKENLNFRLKLEVIYEEQKLQSVVFDPAKAKYGVQYTASNIEDNANNPESGLDMDFEIEKSLEGDIPSKCTLTIWNLSEDVFNLITKRGMGFHLYYARGNNDWSLLFYGEPWFASQGNPLGGNNDAKGFLKRDEAVGGENDIPTTIYLQSELNAYEEAYISKSYQGYVSTEQIIRDCAEAMGLGCNIQKEIKHKKVNNYVARGKASEELEKIVKELDVPASQGKPAITYDNNNVNVYIDGLNIDIFFNVTNSNNFSQTVYGYVFDKDNSTRPEKEVVDKEEYFKFKTQLLPDLTAGIYCMCDFSNLKGKRQIKKVVSIGNNYGTEGETEVWVNV